MVVKMQYEQSIVFMYSFATRISCFLSLCNMNLCFFLNINKPRLRKSIFNIINLSLLVAKCEILEMLATGKTPLREIKLIGYHGVFEEITAKHPL